MDWTPKTIMEPFKIKAVEPIAITTRAERKAALEAAHYNPFSISAEKVTIDFLTDSGTGAMSAAQWAALMNGDESYAGARSYYRFEKVVKELTGFEEIIPTHQGRAAEKILFQTIAKKGIYIISNSHFDTTRANVEYTGAEAVDFPAEGALDWEKPAPFKGNANVAAMEKFIKEKGAENIALCVMTVTNNSLGGQPVSMQNLKEVKELCSKYGIKMFLDTARFAENAYFIKTREPGYENRSIKEIAQEMYRLADGAWQSSKKDAIVNIGGWLAMNDKDLSLRCRQLLILMEGFNTYGGLAGRDLDAMAVGLEEVLNEDYLRYRIVSTEYLGNAMLDMGIPIINPPGGHGVYVDAKKYLPHIKPDQFPAQSLTCALYLEGGIRAVEIGMLMFGKRDENGKFLPADMELVRLAIPRRVYTQSHLDYVIEVFGHLTAHKEEINGLEVVEAANILPHFTAKLRPVSGK